jgi:hypothetical protein
MWLGLSLLGFGLAISLHATIARLGGSLTIVLGFLSVATPVAVLIALVAFWLFGFSDEGIAAVLVYLALCETYIFLFTLAANGVSVSLMMRLRSHPTTAEALMESYSTRAMVERRIDQLQAAGLLMDAGGDIHLLEGGRRLVRAFRIVRGIFNHPQALGVFQAAQRHARAVGGRQRYARDLAATDDPRVPASILTAAAVTPNPMLAQPPPPDQT